MRTIPVIASLILASAASCTLVGIAYAQEGASNTRSPVGTIADKPTTKSGRYSRDEEGWFWYKQEPEPPEPEAKKKPEPIAAAGEPPKHKPLSAEWLRDNLDKYRFLAIDEPTKDNMEMYLLLQKLAMDKSEQFALAHRQYSMLNPGIDETIANPTGGSSRQSQNNAQEAGMNDALAKVGEKVGLWYFFRSDCQFCHQQNPAIDILTRVGKVNVLPISVDGKSSLDGALANWKPDQGQAQMLGVTGTPTMYLVNPETKKIVLLASGVRTFPDMQRRIVEIAKQESWISNDDYDKAMRGLPRRFLTEGLASTEDVDEGDPKALLALLREASSHGGVVEGTLTPMDASTMTPWKPKTNVANRGAQ